MMANRFSPKKVTPYVFSIVCLIMCYIFYMEWSLIGFPDGHKTELDAAYEKIYPVYMAVCFLFALFFIRMGIRAQKFASPRPLCVLASLFVVFVAFTFGLREYLLQLLELGQGG